MDKMLVVNDLSVILQQYTNRLYKPVTDWLEMLLDSTALNM